MKRLNKVTWKIKFFVSSFLCILFRGKEIKPHIFIYMKKYFFIKINLKLIVLKYAKPKENKDFSFC